MVFFLCLNTSRRFPYVEEFCGTFFLLVAGLLFGSSRLEGKKPLLTFTSLHFFVLIDSSVFLGVVPARLVDFSPPAFTSPSYAFHNTSSTFLFFIRFSVSKTVGCPFLIFLCQAPGGPSPVTFSRSRIEQDRLGSNVRLSVFFFPRRSFPPFCKPFHIEASGRFLFSPFPGSFSPLG